MLEFFSGHSSQSPCARPSVTQKALVSAVGAQLHAILIAEAEVLAGNAFGRHWFRFPWVVTHVLLHIFPFLFETSPVKRCPIWVFGQGAKNHVPVKSRKPFSCYVFSLLLIVLGIEYVAYLMQNGLNPYQQES